MLCRICAGRADELFRKKVLDRYDVGYYRCLECGFLQTEEPFWLEEAYSEPLSALDTGLVARPMQMAIRVDGIIRRLFDPAGRFLDYGGGPGLFVRIMRDRGFCFYRYDRYVAPLFCRYFDLEDLPAAERRFELVTAIEVLEHLQNPAVEIGEMLELADSILCTTELIPEVAGCELSQWWYLGESHGQHVSFFTVGSLSRLADLLGCAYFQLEPSLHVLTRLRDFEKRLDRERDDRVLEPLTWRDLEFVTGRRRRERRRPPASLP